MSRFRRIQRIKFRIVCILVLGMWWIWERIETLEHGFYDGLMLLAWPAVFVFEMRRLGSPKPKWYELPIVALMFISMGRGAQLIMIALAG